MIRPVRRLWYLLRRDRQERELDDELRFHLEMRRQELESRGLDPDAAALAARRALGNLPLTREQVRDVWIVPWMQGAMQDVRHGFRTLRRQPGFAAVAATTLAGADPSVLGRVLTIRGQAATVVAVMPRGFAFPARTEVWGTARPFRPVAETGPPDFYVYLVGRLAPGATVEQSAAEFTNYLRSDRAELPATLRGMTASAEALDDDLLGDVRPVILLLLAASARDARGDRQRRGPVPGAGPHQTAGARRAGGAGRHAAPPAAAGARGGR